jgi:hypothetical protein
MYFAEERRLEPGFDDVERRGDDGAAHSAETVEDKHVSRAIPEPGDTHPPATKCCQLLAGMKFFFVDVTLSPSCAGGRAFGVDGPASG